MGIRGVRGGVRYDGGVVYSYIYTYIPIHVNVHGLIGLCDIFSVQ